MEIVEYEEKHTEEISNIIIRNLLEINSNDYGIEKAKEMAKDFTVEKLRKTLNNREKVFVALINGEVIGTAGIEKSWYADDEYWILTVFVKPENQGQNIGRLLINKIEEYARKLQIKKLVIPASITAHEFYYKLGYRYKDGKKELNENNMYIMEKNINNDNQELELIFPTEEYRERVMEYLQEHIDNNEPRMHGVGGLDKIKDFDKWLQKVQNDLSEKTVEEGRVPATLYLAVRKLDNKVIGIIQIRHELNKKLLKYGGHIGDGVRPSERKKGYATEMIRLALEECKKIGIKRVLMVCDKDNISSKKSIINNGGILENEVLSEDGKIIQRYWISLKKKYADVVNKYKNVIQVEQKLIAIDNQDFTGDIYLNNFTNISEPFLLENGLCIQDNNYKWLEFYDYNSKIRMTAIYDEKNEIVEWYFDMARSLGKENNTPYEDDLYLDVVLRPDGEIILLDEDELKEALDRYEMTKEEYEKTYEIARDLMARIKNKKNEVKKFTDKYLKIIMKNC